MNASRPHCSRSPTSMSEALALPSFIVAVIALTITFAAWRWPVNAGPGRPSAPAPKPVFLPKVSTSWVL